MSARTFAALGAALALTVAAPAVGAPARIRGQMTPATAPALLSSGLASPFRVPFRDTILVDGPPRSLQVRVGSAGWGGAFATSTGETVNVQVEVYADTPANRAVAQQWAEFFARLPHRAEDLSGLTVELGPLSFVQSVCRSQEALACYSPQAEQLFLVPNADELPPGIQGLREEIAAHEFGHNIANHRDNKPWTAEETGPKRWASYENVCARTQAGTAFPGDEGARYTLNPGEAWAETYRSWIESTTVGSSFPWGPLPFGVDSSFAPTPDAIAAAQADVLEPWAPGRESSWRGRLTKRGRYRASRVVATPLDGILDATLLSAPRGSSLTLAGPNGKRIDGPRREVGGLACGARTVTVTLRGKKAGRFAVTVGQP